MSDIVPEHVPAEDVTLDVWNPREALSSLESERTKLEEITATDSAERIFRDALPLAAKSIVHLAAYSNNESLRFKAAVYVAERNLGRIQDAPPLTPPEDDPFTKLVKELAAYDPSNSEGS